MEGNRQCLLAFILVGGLVSDFVVDLEIEAGRLVVGPNLDGFVLATGRD